MINNTTSTKIFISLSKETLLFSILMTFFIRFICLDYKTAYSFIHTNSLYRKPYRLLNLFGKLIQLLHFQIDEFRKSNL